MSVDDDSHENAVHICRYFLMPIGIWPLPADAGFLARLLQMAAVIASFSLICFLLLPCALHTFLEEPNPAIKLKLIGPMSFILISFGKYCALVSSIKSIGDCFQRAEEDCNDSRRAAGATRSPRESTELLIMRGRAKVGNYLTLLSAAFMYSGGFFYHVVMPLSSGRIATTAMLEKLAELDMKNSTAFDANTRVPRALTYPVYEHLMNVQNSPWYEIVFVVQFMSGFVLYTITVGAVSLAAGFVAHVCAQLEIVMHLLGEFVRGTDAGSNSKMKEIVDKHFRVLNFAGKVESNLNVVFFIEFVGCTFDICLLGYYVITEWERRNTISTMTYCILLTSFIFNIFIFCFIGEMLTEQCKRLGDITYAIDWYRMPAKRAVDIIMIIVISSCHPARITAGKMVYLSMASFSTVIKTAAAYLNLLRAVTL